MNALAQDGVELSVMTPEDVAEVMTIEPRAYLVPWTEGIIRDCMRVGYECRVARRQGEIIAYAFMSVALGEAHLLNLTVKPEYQGQGYGRMMLLYMLEQARQLQADVAFLEVRPSNKKARRLYRSLGFTQIGRRKGYYPGPDGREDALVFSLLLIDGV